MAASTTAGARGSGRCSPGRGLTSRMMREPRLSIVPRPTTLPEAWSARPASQTFRRAGRPGRSSRDRRRSPSRWLASCPPWPPRYWLVRQSRGARMSGAPTADPQPARIVTATAMNTITIERRPCTAVPPCRTRAEGAELGLARLGGDVSQGPGLGRRESELPPSVAHSPPGSPRTTWSGLGCRRPRAVGYRLFRASDRPSPMPMPTPRIAHEHHSQHSDRSRFHRTVDSAHSGAADGLGR